MVYVFRFSPLVALLLLGACTTIPEGPSHLVLPGTMYNVPTPIALSHSLTACAVNSRPLWERI